MKNRSQNRYANRVGLDIGTQCVKGVEITERGGEIIVRAAGSAPIAVSPEHPDSPDQNAVIQAIKNLWSSARFQSRNVVVAMPPESVYTKWLHLEASCIEELERTANQTALRGAPFPAEDAILDYRVLSSRGRSSRNVYFVMLAAASGKATDKLLDITDKAGLEPLAVDIGAAAACRILFNRKKSTGLLWSGQPNAHCIMGAKHTTIAVIRQDTLEFVRTVPVGGNEFTQALMENTSLSWNEAEKIKTSHGARITESGVMIASVGNEELKSPCEGAVGRLAREITRSLRFFTSQFAEGSYLGMIGALTWSGGGSLLRGLDECLGQQGIEITDNINPFAGLSVDASGSGIQHIEGSAAIYTTAVGLALGDYWSRPVEIEVVTAA